MVDMKVASLPLNVMLVTTELLINVDFMFSPCGGVEFSGEIALAMAVAVLSSEYSRVIVACNFFAF